MKFKEIELGEGLLNIANVLTFSRILISPLFLLVYLYAEEIGMSPLVQPFLLLFLLLLVESTDALDGFIARKYNLVTDMGKLLDPMADSISRISIFLTFTTGIVQLPIGIVFIFLYRDACVSTLRTLCAMKGIVLAARPSGKLKAIIQALATFIITVSLIPYAFGMISLETLRRIALYSTLCAALYALVSAFEYFYTYRHYLKQFMQSGLSNERSKT